MGLIIARVKLTCPKTKEEVDMIKDCYECEEYAHFGLQGPLILVLCKAAPQEKGSWQKEVERIKKSQDRFETERWLKQAKEEGMVSDEKKAESS